jgi:23S rRNA (uridine2552-2'-O)-methyltransferase
MVRRFFSRWMQRHLSDGYVKQAQKDGFRSRSAYKLMEINQQAHILAPGFKVLDLGCTPGGWSQVALDAISKKPGFKLVSVDILPMNPLADCTFIQLDMLHESSIQHIMKQIEGQFDTVLCDMSSNHSGITDLDCMETIELNNMALSVCGKLLKKGGAIVMKVLTGAAENEHFVSPT